MNLGNVVGIYEKSNRIAAICDISPAKPMFPLALDIHGIWLTADVATGNPHSYRKSATAGNLESLQEIRS